MPSEMMKCVDKTFFAFKYQEGFETAEFHADIKSGEKVENNITNKVITQSIDHE
jgi:hypothetical protein